MYEATKGYYADF